MEPNKFEKQIKEQLQGREIKPSDEAWNRISRQLEGSEKSESPGRPAKLKRFQWYGIAAGFIGILFVSVLYLASNGPSSDPETEITDVTQDSVPVNLSPVPTSPVVIQEESFSDENAIVDSKAREEKNIENTFRRHPDITTGDALASSKAEEVKPEKVAVFRNTSKEMVHEKIAEIVAQVEVLEKENNSVTDAEIDSLLRSAQRQILEDEIFQKDRSVDAMALLADVEDELDRSFRDQIFDALKDGFLKVRTAVADRNK